MLRKSSPPIEPRRDRGADDRDRPRREEGRERGGDGDVVALVDGVAVGLRSGRCSAGPRSCRPRGCRETAKPASAKTRSIGAFPDMTSATNDGDPGRGGRLGQLLEQPRPDALALQRVGDGERHLGGRGVAQPDVVRERDDLVVQACRRARRGRPSRDRGTARPSRAEAWGSRGSGGRRSARRARRGTRARRRRRRPPGAQPERSAVAEDDVANLGIGRDHRAQCRPCGARAASVGPRSALRQIPDRGSACPTMAGSPRAAENGRERRYNDEPHPDRHRRLRRRVGSGRGRRRARLRGRRGRRLRHGRATTRPCSEIRTTSGT